MTTQLSWDITNIWWDSPVNVYSSVVSILFVTFTIIKFRKTPSPQKRKLVPISSHSRFFSSLLPSQSLTTSNLFSIFMYLFILDLLYKWNLIICSFLWLPLLWYMWLLILGDWLFSFSVMFLRYRHVIERTQGCLGGSFS